jgi:hypothetical protein
MAIYLAQVIEGSNMQYPPLLVEEPGEVLAPLPRNHECATRFLSRATPSE